MNVYYPNPGVEFDWPEPAESEAPLVARHYGDSAGPVPIEDPAVVGTFAAALDGATEEALAADLADRTGLDADAAGERVHELLDAGLLVADGPAVRQGRDWLEHGWRRSLYYHLATRDWAPPTAADDRAREAGGATAETGPPPDGTVSLPEPDALPDRPFDEVLFERRTCRSFDGSGLPAGALSTLLAHGLGPVRDASEHGVAPPGLQVLETAAFPFVVRPVVARSPDLDPGTYRYLLDEHALAPVDAAVGETPVAVDRAVSETVVDQPFVEDAAVTLLLTADLDAYRRLRPHAGAVRQLFLAVSGHLQRLLLAATAMGLDCFQSAAFDDSRAAALAGVDGVSEPVVYLLTVGEGAT